MDKTMPGLKDKKILLGVGGGIAAYKTCEVLRRLTDAGADVHVVMTRSAQQFVTPLTFQSLSKNPVHTDLFNLNEESEINHIKLADEADLVVITPTTANLIGKLASGLADDLLTTAILVARAPVFLAPSMNVNMWEKDVVQQNLQTLRDRGFQIIEPEEGFLACGWEGKGRVADPAVIVQALAECKITKLSSNKKKSLTGKKILINAGPTREYLDPVRFISNPSSGKMGFALAQEAEARGAQVTLVTGPVNLPTPPGVGRVEITTAQEMLEVCLKQFSQVDVFIGTAAVGDYRPKIEQKQKIKKKKQGLNLDLIPNPDILLELSQKKKPGQFLVGFAAETENILENAKKKLSAKKLDLIVANDVSKTGTGFASDLNQALFLDAQGGEEKNPLLTKTELAIQILDRIEGLISPKKRPLLSVK